MSRNSPLDYEYCEVHQIAFAWHEGCPVCRTDHEDEAYDRWKDEQLFKEG